MHQREYWRIFQRVWGESWRDVVWNRRYAIALHVVFYGGAVIKALGKWQGFDAKWPLGLLLLGVTVWWLGMDAGKGRTLFSWRRR